MVNGDDYTIDGEVYTLASGVSNTNLELGNDVEAVVEIGYIFAAELVSGSISMVMLSTSWHGRKRSATARLR